MPEITDKDTAFVRILLKELKLELDRQIVGVDFTSAKQKKRFIEKARELIKKSGLKFSDELLKEIDGAWQDEVFQAQKELKKVPKEWLRTPNADVLKLLTTLDQIKSGVKNEVDTLFDTSILKMIYSLNNLEAKVKNEVLASITAGSISGQSIDEISMRIKKAFLDGGIPGFSFENKNGKTINVSLEASAERLTRHSIITSRQRATIMQASQNGYDLVKISKHGDESPMCKTHSGKIYSISGLTEGYPLLSTALWNGTYKVGAGIGWPWCRHTLLIHIPTSIKFKTYEGDYSEGTSKTTMKKNEAAEKRRIREENKKNEEDRKNRLKEAKKRGETITSGQLEELGKRLEKNSENRTIEIL